MTDRLLIRLTADGRLAWLPPGADAATAGAVAGTPPADVLARMRPVTVLVPSAEVLLLDAPALSRQRAQLQRAVPFALEDQLVQAVEDLHFALAPAPVDGRIGVAVVQRSRLAAWLERLAEVGIVPDALVPDSLCMPVGAVLIERGQSVLKLGPWRACAVETPQLAEWLALMAAELPESLEIFDAREAPRLGLPGPVGEYHERVRDPLALLSSGLRGEPAVNLLQGEFAPRHRAAPAQRWWRIAAALAAAAIGLGLLHLIVERALLQRESDRLDAAMRAQLLQTFPEMEKVAGEPARLMQSGLARLGGGGRSGLLRTLGQVAPVLGSTTRLVTRGLEYRNGALELSVTSPDLATLDALRERLASLPGLKVELTGATNGANGVEGRIRVSEGGA